MPKNNSLYITKRILELASGIDKKMIDNDIAEGLIRVNDDGLIWYRTASQYVTNKWQDGKVNMYDPNMGEPDHNFSSRVLSLLDDDIAAGNVSITWKR
jgi:hypothetical protein